MKQRLLVPHFMFFRCTEKSALRDTDSQNQGAPGYPEGGRNMFPRMYDLRKDHGISQQEMAKLLGCSQQCYIDHECGRRKMSINMLIKLSKVYGVSTDYILGLTDNPKPRK